MIQFLMLAAALVVVQPLLAGPARKSPGPSEEKTKSCAILLTSGSMHRYLEPGFIFEKNREMFVILGTERWSSDGDGFLDDKRIEVMALESAEAGPRLFRDSQFHLVGDRHFFEGLGLVAEARLQWHAANLRRLKEGLRWSRDLPVGAIVKSWGRNFVVTHSAADHVLGRELSRDGSLSNEISKFLFYSEERPEAPEALEWAGMAEIYVTLKTY